MTLTKGALFGVVMAVLVLGMIAAPVTRAGPMLFDDDGALYAGKAQLGPPTAGIILDGQFSTVQTKEILLYAHLIPDVQGLTSRYEQLVRVPARALRGYPIGTYARATDLGAWRS